MAVRAKVLGRDAVMARLRRLVPDAEKEAAKAQLEAAQELAAAIKARAPVVTGEYRNSIEGALLSSKPKGKKLVGPIRDTKDPNATGIFALYIWRFLEFGTKAGVAGTKTAKGRKVKRTHRGTKAQPHIMPTYRAMKKRIRRKIATAINKAVRKAKG